MIGDMAKFSFAEMFSNNNGKTSASGVVGFMICTVGAGCFILNTCTLAFKVSPINVLPECISLIYAGAMLLGYRKSTDKAEISAGIVNVAPDPNIDPNAAPAPNADSNAAPAPDQQPKQLNS